MQTSILLTNPVVRGCGYAIAATLSLRGYAVHVALDDSLPGILCQSKFYRSTNIVFAPRGTLVHGVLDRENSESESKYLAQLQEIILKRKIALIFPATEVDVYFMSRNRRALMASGAKVLVPPIETMMQVSDKYAVIATAQAHSFPVVEAFLCDSIKSLERDLERIGSYPVILKARSGMGSGYVWRATNWRQILDGWAAAQQIGVREIILQKFIPGGKERSLNYLISPDGLLLCSFALAKPHHAFPSQSTSVVVITPPKELQIGASMLQSLGICWFTAIQTIFDASDGQHKILEINTRLGSNSRILHGMGIDLATWMVESALNPDAACGHDVSIGISGISLLESLIAVRSYLSARKSQIETPTGISFMMSYFRLIYSRPSLDIHTKNSLRDLVGYRSYLQDIFAQYRHACKASSLTSMIPWGDLNYFSSQRSESQLS